MPATVGMGPLSCQPGGHHSGAHARAHIAGFGEIYIAEFALDESLPHRELYFCDMTVALDGKPTTVQERLLDVRRRHRDNAAMIGYLDANEASIIAMVACVWAEFVP